MRPGKIRFYLRAMQEIGVEPERVLSGTNITIPRLNDPYTLIEVSSYIHVISNIIQLCEGRPIAFDLGKYLTLGDLGILGYCVMTCPDTEEATALWHQYNPVFFG